MAAKTDELICMFSLVKGRHVIKIMEINAEFSGFS
jgi:hypothetical protein